jgi:DNA-directed RNA polymerase subunit RPC12/RpoP
LDVELPRDLQATFSERAKSVLQRNFKCELCQQGFKTEAFLNQHKMSFHKNELLSDGASSSNGTTVVGLSMAQQLASERSFGASHGGGASFMKSYDCRFCGKQFSKMSKLTQHMKIHSNPEDHYKYPCDICGKKFTRPQHVNRHKLLHTGERPFKCNKCEKAFSREDRLKQHKLKGCDNDPPVVSNYQNPLMMNAARSNTREIPSTSNENQWIIEHPSTDNDNGENGLEENGANDEEQNFYIDEDGDNEESMVVDASIVGEDEESLEEVSAEPIYSNPNSDEEDDGGEAEQSRDHEDLEEVEEEEEES